MSEYTKKSAQEAQEFYRKVSEKSEIFRQSIPDKTLGDKLKKVGELSSEVSKYLEKNLDHPDRSRGL